MKVKSYDSCYESNLNIQRLRFLNLWLLLMFGGNHQCCYGQFNTATTPAPFNFPPEGFNDNLDNAYLCESPEKLRAACISIYACPPLLKTFLNSPNAEETEKFLEQSYCLNGFGRWPFVCCTDKDRFGPDFSTPKPVNAEKQMGDIFPGFEECKASNESEIHWMGRLEYEKHNTTINTSQCLAMLITSRYALTAAHCVSKKSSRDFGKVRRINFSKFFMELYDRNETFNQTEIVFEVEDIILSKIYDENSLSIHHDIALIRISSEIQFGKLVGTLRPICMPSIFEEKISESGSPLVIEKIDLKRGRINVKKANLEKYESEICEKWFENKNISLNSAEICIDGNEIDCHQTSAAPLFIEIDGSWMLAGISAFETECGMMMSSFPRVFTRISIYEDWIRETVKA